MLSPGRLQEIQLRKRRARAGLDLLFATYAEWDVLEVGTPTVDALTGSSRRDVPGPWLLVTLGQPSSDGGDAFVRHHFAIWKATGDVHGVQHDGSVTDDPLLSLADV